MEQLKAKRIYIAGKVTGLPKEQVVKKFNLAANKVRNSGHTPINPIEVVNDWKCTWEEAMRKCIAALVTCDAIYKLPCCSDSPGAKIELDLADKLNIPILDNVKS